jgi:hypothetical protein
MHANCAPAPATVRSRAMRRVLFCLLFVSAPAFAQTPHREGEYGGVSPGMAASAAPSTEGTKARKRAPAGTLTWLGFEARDGGALVFFQSVAPFEVSQRIEGGSLVVQLGLSRLATNTARPIETRFFDNPLSRITARKIGAHGRKARAGSGTGIEVRIAFKNTSDVREGQVRSETGPDGMHYVYLAFPPSAGAATGPTLDEPER